MQRFGGRTTFFWHFLCVALAAYAAGCADDEAYAYHDFVQDGIEGAQRAQVRLPSPVPRILFSPNSGAMPTSGGERNLAFLAVAAQHSGFASFCFSEEGALLDLLRLHGVNAISGMDALLFDLPPHVPQTFVKVFNLALATWRADSECDACRAQVHDAFDAMDAWVTRGEACPDERVARTITPDSIVMHALRLRRVMRYHHIDTVVADGDDQALAALLARGQDATRILFYAQSTPPERFDGMFARSIDMLACSDSSARRFSTLYPEARVSILRNGINTRRFAPPAEPLRALRDCLGLADDAFLIGHTGYLAGGKNQAAIVRGAMALFAEHPNVHVVLVGGEATPGYKEQLIGMAKAKDFETHLHFLGVRSDVDAILKELDLFVFPSRAEGFGLGLAEAMATGVPAVASDLAAFHEYTGDTVEHIGPIDDNVSLPAAMLEVILHPVEARARALRSRQYIIDKGVHTDRMVEEFAIILGATRKW